jgi:hypothetical protein
MGQAEGHAGFGHSFWRHRRPSVPYHLNYAQNPAS